MNLRMLSFAPIVIYISIITYLGYSTSKKKSSEGFLIADRNLKVFYNAATIVASKIGAGIILTFVALFYLYGLSAMWIFIGVSTGYVIFIPFAVKLKQISSVNKFYTFSDYFFYKHGNTVGYMSAFAVFVVTLLFLLLQLIGGSKILARLSGFSFSGSLIIILITMLVYMVLGGFKAVVKTDMVQLISIILLMAIIGFIMAKGSWGPFVSNVLSKKTLTPASVILVFFSIGILMPFFSAELWQRVYAASDARTVRWSLLLSALAYPLIGSLFAIVGVAISVNLRDIDPELAMVEGLVHLVPAGLLGLGVIIFSAAIMSSADSCLFACISILLQDIYARFKPVEKEKLVKNFQYAIALMLLICFFLSVWLQNIVLIVYIAVAFGGVLSVTTLVSWFVKTIKPIILATGMAVGFTGTFINVVTQPITETLVLKAIAFTVLGLFLGSVINLISLKKVRSHYGKNR